MTKLFVANCTRQVQEVHFRLDFTDAGQPNPQARFQPAKRMTIPPGRQVPLGGDLHMSQVDDVTKQLETFGLTALADVPRSRGKLIPLLYNVDTPLKPSQIEAVMNANAGILVEQGRERRQAASIATNALVDQVVANEFAAVGLEAQTGPKVEVEFEQLEQSEAGERKVEEGYRMDAKAKPPAVKKSKRK